MLGSIPMAVAASHKLGVANAKELIALLKRTPDALNFGSSGAGSISHHTTEMFLEDIGATARHIPFQGPSPMTTALLSGQIDFASQGLPVFQPHFKSGALKPIAICSSSRSSVASGLPTFAEQGQPNLLVEAWVTLIGPKGMDPGLIRKMRDAAAKAFENPASRDQLARQGTVIAVTSSEEARSTITRDLHRYAAIVKKIGFLLQ
jgi:tripartite-type tricarboxylate transporter receptor subunit TctC